jgi:hypothetical protein
VLAVALAEPKNGKKQRAHLGAGSKNEGRALGGLRRTIARRFGHRADGGGTREANLVRKPATFLF